MPRSEVPDNWGRFARELGVNLRRARHESGLTQEEAAYSAGLTRSYYQQLEKGNSRPGSPANPTLAVVTSLARLFHRTLDELVPSLDLLDRSA